MIHTMSAFFQKRDLQRTVRESFVHRAQKLACSTFNTAQANTVASCTLLHPTPTITMYTTPATTTVSPDGSDEDSNGLNWTWPDYVKCVVAIVGTVGNGLVISVYIKNRQMRSPTNELLAGLAVADLITSVLMFPWVRSWDCIRTYFNIVLMWVAITISIFTLVFVTVERYVAISYPTKYSVIFSKTSRIRLVGIIWFLAIAFNIYQLFIWFDVDGVCSLIWPSTMYEKVSGIGVFLLQYLIPVAIMSYTTATIMLKLRAETKILLAKNEPLDSPAFTSLRSKQKVVDMLLVVVVTFIICWTPEQLAHFGFTMGFVPPT